MFIASHVTFIENFIIEFRFLRSTGKEKWSNLLLRTAPRIKAFVANIVNSDIKIHTHTHIFKEAMPRISRRLCQIRDEQIIGLQGTPVNLRVGGI